ncbi:MAG: hypothetical protein ACJAQ3_002034, partial [Planctomycetota bacterium]
MMLNIQPRVLSLLPVTTGLLFALAMPQGWASSPFQAGAGGVAVIKSTFQKLDGDKNGSVTAAESRKGKISGELFGLYDFDKSQTLSADEFVVLYKDLLVKNNRPVDKGVVSEVARIQARRRALAKEKEAKAAREELQKAEAAKAVARKRAAEAKAAPVKGDSNVVGAKTNADVQPAPTATKAVQPVAVPT